MLRGEKTHVEKWFSGLSCGILCFPLDEGCRAGLCGSNTSTPQLLGSAAAHEGVTAARTTQQQSQS